jgi:hypothetical protein
MGESKSSRNSSVARQEIATQGCSRRFHTVAEIQGESQTTTHTWSQKHQYNNSWY